MTSQRDLQAFARASEAGSSALDAPARHRANRKRRSRRGAPPPSRSEDAVLLTGATGFLGAELLARYLERTDRNIYALVRGASQREAAARIERTLDGLFGPGHPYEERVAALRGDLTRARLGFGRRGESLAERAGESVQGAASGSFGNDLRTARAINVEGTRRMLEFGERCHARGAALPELEHASRALHVYRACCPQVVAERHRRRAVHDLADALCQRLAATPESQPRAREIPTERRHTPLIWMPGPEQPVQRALDARRGLALARAPHERVDVAVGSLQIAGQELSAEEPGGAREQNRVL